MLRTRLHTATQKQHKPDAQGGGHVTVGRHGTSASSGGACAFQPSACCSAEPSRLTLPRSYFICTPVSSLRKVHTTRQESRRGRAELKAASVLRKEQTRRKQSRNQASHLPTPILGYFLRKLNEPVIAFYS